MTHNEKLKIFIQDLKKVIVATKYLENIETTILNSPLDELLEYGMKWKIIDGSYDILKICHEIPEIENKVTSLYDEKIRKELEIKGQNFITYNKYVGTYDRLEDVPGYGIEWNNRCIPDGVVIRGSKNGRC